MKLNRRNKIIISFVLILLVVIFSSNVNVVNAEINTSYGEYAVDSVGLNEAMENSNVLDLIGHLVYAVGRMLEWILGTIFTAITGTTDFPWADRIVFNAVAILDVNFINPNAKSFIGGTISSTISNAYATIFSLSVSFFGIFAMISAIKLAISAVAEEKAKYKKALVDWFMGLIMLFTIHYFMSFMLYLNEQLVVIASNMAKNAVNAASIKLEVQASETAMELLDKLKSASECHLDAAQIQFLEDNIDVMNTWVTLGSSVTSNGLIQALNGDYAFPLNPDKTEQYNNLYAVVEYVVKYCPSIDRLDEIKQKVFYYNSSGSKWYTCLVNEGGDIFNVKGYQGVIGGSGDIRYNFGHGLSSALYHRTGSGIGGKTIAAAWSEITSSTDVISNSAITVVNKKGRRVWEEEELYNRYGLSDGSYGTNNLNSVVNPDGTRSFDQVSYINIINDLKKLKSAANNAKLGGSSGAVTNPGVLLSSLAQYFKETSYDMELRSVSVTGTKSSGNIQITNAIMYAVMVAQSLILFIAYVKRLFYTLILGLISPAVVAYDFFKRFGK